MFYKPNFCANCGEKVERSAWKPWTSGRFCEVCESEFAHHEWLSRGTAFLILAMFLFSLGMFLRSPDKSANTKPSLAEHELKQIAANGEPSLARNAATNSNQALSGTSENRVVAALPQTLSSKVANANFSPRVASADTDLSYCGARTKKGTPCTRKVKRGIRCWQHTGQPAMLSEMELRVQR